MSNTDKPVAQEAIMELVESYCENRHTLGAPEYNHVTAGARAKLLDALAAPQPSQGAEDPYHEHSIPPVKRVGKPAVDAVYLKHLQAQEGYRGEHERAAYVADLLDTFEQLRQILGTPEQDADALIAEVRRIAAPRRPVSAEAGKGVSRATECRHCGWLCMPNNDKSRDWYPLSAPSESVAVRDAPMPQPEPTSKGEGWPFAGTHKNEVTGFASQQREPQEASKPESVAVSGEVSEDTKRLDYLQQRGATVEILPGGAGKWMFRIGGSLSSVSYDIRAAIDHSRAVLAH